MSAVSAEQSKPDDFDWVDAVAKSKVHAAYQRLMDDIDSDVKKIKELSFRDGVEFEFSLGSISSRVSRIIRAGRTREKSAVIFRRKLNAIEVVSEVNDNKSAIFSAVPILTPGGDLRMLVDNEYLDPWQFRRKALENIFFGHLDQQPL